MERVLTQKKFFLFNKKNISSLQQKFNTPLYSGNKYGKTQVQNRTKRLGSLITTFGL